MKYRPLPDLPPDFDEALDESKEKRNPYLPPPKKVDAEQVARKRRALFLRTLPAGTVVVAVIFGLVIGLAIREPDIRPDALFGRKSIEFLDRSGGSLQSFESESFEAIDPDDLPLRLKQAILVSEDPNFYRHSGFDLGRSFGVMSGLRSTSWLSEKGTISSQVARRFFKSRSRGWKRRIAETHLVFRLESQFSKSEILALWAGMEYFGYSQQGIKGAAIEYFGKDLADLTVAESATLAGLPELGVHDVRSDLKRVAGRRKEILRKMFESSYINSDEFSSAMEEPVKLSPAKSKSFIGRFFFEEVQYAIEEEFGQSALGNQSFQASSTLDRSVQTAAEIALRDGLLRSVPQSYDWEGPIAHLSDQHLDEGPQLSSWSSGMEAIGDCAEGVVQEVQGSSAKVNIVGKIYPLDSDGISWAGVDRVDNLVEPGDVFWFCLGGESGKTAKASVALRKEPRIDGAVVVLESATGAIRALVGGWKYRPGGENRATRIAQPIGALAYPFVFAAGLEYGFTAADTLFDGPFSSQEPEWADRSFKGITTLRAALRAENKNITLKLFDLVGAERVSALAKKCGFASEVSRQTLKDSDGIRGTPLEVAAAYSTLANRGRSRRTYLLESLRMENRETERGPRSESQAIDPRFAYILLKMLSDPLARSSFEPSGRKIVEESFGLRAETESGSWFVGATPELTIVVWVGVDPGDSLLSFNKRISEEIWVDIVRRGAEEGWISREAAFEEPAGLVRMKIDPESGFQVASSTDRSISEIFVRGTEPSRMKDSKAALVSSLPWYLQQVFYLPKESEPMPEWN